MAARNSCTHLTWSQAKGNERDLSGKKKKNVIQVSHGKALTAKIVAKHSVPADVTKAEIRKAKRQEEKLLVLAEKRAEERRAERIRLGTVRPFEMAMARMAELAMKRQAAAASTDDDDDDDDDDYAGLGLVERKNIAECREMQLDEMAALEAIYAETNEFLPSAASDADGLREKVEAWREADTEEHLRSVVRHPAPCFGLQLVVEDAARKYDGTDVVATLLLQVELPRSYPESELPALDVAYFAVTDRAAVCNVDKVFESLAHLDRDGLLEGLAEQARQIVPYPCVYELASTWLTEHLFDYCELHAH